MFIMNNIIKVGVALLFLALISVPCIGELTSIRAGGTVFLGEEGLDITASGVVDGDRIGWWAPGSSVTSEPTDVVTISSPDSFYVSPSTFSGKEGLWYTWPGKIPVFQVKQPKISIRVYDETADFDGTGKWIPRGDAISFRISSNVFEANSRGGSSGQADVVLMSPEGAKYSSVSGPSGSFSLEGIPLTSSLTNTGPVWSTGGVDTGTWTVRAELSMNRIKDNLPDIGEGVSETMEVLIQNVNPLIKSDVAIEIGDSADTKLPVKEVTRVITPLPTITVIPKTPLPTVQKTEQTPVPVTTMPNTTIPAATPVPSEEPPVTTSPLPETTQSPIGFLPILGGILFMILVRRS
ncbi:hypothetical protein DLD82_17035 [Methanospirillum stamsii]|uniref:DUF3821 domain-containing protein n=2 Tax=Methanospirillum stamsii TaxID=1277351 RepID=A0A2V2MNT8_9EURY|nr:hypothetical protein DLD82_17035 [Methanospirillum stamsii]